MYIYIYIYIIIYDYIWLYMIIYDYIWLYMIIYDYIWLYMIVYDYILLYIIYCYVYYYIYIHMNIYIYIYEYEYIILCMTMAIYYMILITYITVYCICLSNDCNVHWCWTMIRAFCHCSTLVLHRLPWFQAHGLPATELRSWNSVTMCHVCSLYFPKTKLYPRSLILTILDMHITVYPVFLLRFVFFKPEIIAGVLALTSAATAPWWSSELNSWWKECNSKGCLLVWNPGCPFSNFIEHPRKPALQTFPPNSWFWAQKALP